MANSTRPTPTQVTRRLFILRTVYIAGYLVPPPDVLESLKLAKPESEFREMLAEIQKHFDLRWDPIRRPPFWDELSPDERKFISTPIDQLTPRQFTDAFWRIEAAQALMWCLGLIDAMPSYDTRANEEPLRQPEFLDYSKLLSDAHLRPEPEIEAARAEAELWHWRSRTRELIESGTYPPSHPMFQGLPYNSLDGIVREVARKLAGEIPPRMTIDEDLAAMGKAFRDLTNDEWFDVRSITIERHLALNWVCGFGEDNRWERTPTGT